MYISTVWLMADRGNIDTVIESISENVETLNEWPHISLEGLGQLELAELWKVLSPDVPESHVSEDLLLDRQDQGIYLTTLNRNFIHALEWIEDTRVIEVAKKWGESIERFQFGKVADLEPKLSMLIGMAKQATSQQKVILQAIKT